MIIRKSQAKTEQFLNCHGGSGILHCTGMLEDYEKTSSGFMYIHDNILEPGASIGEHVHDGTEEIYVIIEGHGEMNVDGVKQEVSEGDICITRSGHSHDLTNSTDGPMRMLVICTIV